MGSILFFIGKITAVQSIAGKQPRRGNHCVRPNAMGSIPRGWLVPDRHRNEPISYQSRINQMMFH